MYDEKTMMISKQTAQTKCRNNVTFQMKISHTVRIYNGQYMVMFTYEYCDRIITMY